MMANDSMSWAQSNQARLVEEFTALRELLGERPEPRRRIANNRNGASMQPASAIDTLAEIFELTTFERELLLLCAGVEMDSSLATLCGEAQGRPQRSAVTFSLALGTLSDPHWSALAPSAPLRRFRLIEMEAGKGLTSAPLRIDERVLHYLAGVNRLDTRLEPLLYARTEPEWIAEEHWKLATERIRQIEGAVPPATVLHLCGDDAAGQEGVAAVIAHRSGRQLFVLRLEDTPAAGPELDMFLRTWVREALLLPAFLLLQWESGAPTAAARQLVERIPGPLIICSRDPLRLHRPVERHEVSKPGPSGQKQLWEGALGPVAESLTELIDDLSEQFRLSAETIVTIGNSAVSADGTTDRSTLWNVCRTWSRPRLEDLAERIVPAARWDDLILPELQKQTLLQLASQSRHRMTVHERWGFSARGRRGLGLSALFSGPSGTGKTLAAEVLAGELELDLYRIDLSAVVSKYIGETEKNLKQVFDTAEAGGILLLFDEADALFGKRAEVKDSHDRYANIEVGYLLQRMESFQGLAILTTNLKAALDKSFQRRLRFSVDFPFPDAAQREAIWSRVFPAQTPTQQLMPARLANLNMAGGNIRNIALNAAFLAAEAGGPVEMTHLLHAARLEAVKTERPLSEVEIRGWV
ncbi:MAG TPA: ATP-binding protein [Acidobacteriaceae bacterium]